ncbi:MULTISPECIES: GtrA family protein [unclassified Microbacterium]|uniref:GtrA family protein n=1 Tax=unclassified Microbacterium TaxID=2609290 RepID=UPI000EA972EB|nr:MULTISPECIES: GtrA family protein [unclassified Microbacterium]MBT2484989.1 GtrA family protein [Microbacterium sp. ISL-108]RKN67841.1 GtrA family protein [Microbacterium sp. CGR2]
MNPPSRLRRLAGVGSRFLVVGAVSTLIEIGVFNLLVFVWGWDVVAAKVVASLVALVNAYIGNREWTFRHRDRRGRTAEVALFLATNAVCTVIGAVLVWVGVEAVASVLEREPGALAVNVVNLASIVIVVLLRFVLYHSIVFRTKS